MREISDAMQAAWEAEDKTGPRRPVVRATVQSFYLARHDYDTERAPGGDFENQRHRMGRFTTIGMGHDRPVVEIPNIKSFNWSRSVNQDVAEGTMTLLNADTLAIGDADDSSDLDDFEIPGAFTFSRGARPYWDQSATPSPFGYAENDAAWNHLIVPDRLVRTYEGYGCDLTVTPGRDENLMASGTWLIDEVTYTENGEITVKMRDVGRMMLDQISFPPCIPIQEYPLEWSKIRTEMVIGRDVAGGTWKQLKKNMGDATSSNDEYIGSPYTNEPLPAYVQDNGGVAGHIPNHVLDDRNNTYWLSTGMDDFRDRVYWEFDFDDHTTAIGAVRIQPRNGPYRVYLSLHNGDRWIGRGKIPRRVDANPLSPSSIDNGHDIPYVVTMIADRNISFEHILKRKYGNIRKLRLTVTRLHDSQVGEHPFNAGLRKVHIYTASNVNKIHFVRGPREKSVGNYRDYTDIVKWVCAWGGLFWPPHASGSDFIKLGPGDYLPMTYFGEDPVLPRGNVFGDFQNTGTAGIADLTVDLFDKKPLMDIIGYVRDVVSFNFWIDEIGGAVWRTPNLYKLGNFLSPSDLSARGNKSRTSEIIELNTEQHLLDFSATMNSKNLRNRIFVADTTGKTGVVIQGYRPYRQGFRRVAGWTDQHFANKQECIVMADLIAARQMFDYRRARMRIAGNPAIQIDDQIKILAPVTNDTYYHYVETISSNIDMSTGEWTYDLETHWLGNNPEDAWVINPDIMKGATKAFLTTIGAI